MIGLETALFILGAAFVIISFFITGDNEKTENSRNDIPDIDSLSKLGAGIINDTEKKADAILEETEEKLKKLSNDKIMAVDEYSAQILEKIEANHREVVFLYQMLQDKEEVLKGTGQGLDNVRIECEKLIREGVPKDNAQMTVTVTEEIGQPAKKQAAAADKAASEGTVAGKKPKAKTQQTNPYAMSKPVEKPKFDTDIGRQDKNREIIELYKKKKSVLEISKLLGMGQGEVKLVIDLYGK